MTTAIEPTTHIGQKIQRVRRDRGLRLADVAKGIVSIGYLSMIESGQRTPSDDVLRAISERLEVDVVVLEAESFASARLHDVLALQEAQIEFAMSDYSAASARSRRIIREHPAMAPEATRLLARIEFRQQNVPESLALIRRPVCEVLPPGDWLTEISNDLLAGLALLRSGDMDAAHESLRNAVAQAQEHFAGTDLHATSLLFLGRCQLRRGFLAMAADSFTQCLAAINSLSGGPVGNSAAQHWRNMAAQARANGDLVAAVRWNERAITMLTEARLASHRLRMAMECAAFLMRVGTVDAIDKAADIIHRMRNSLGAGSDGHTRTDVHLLAAELANRQHDYQGALALVDIAIQGVPGEDLAWGSVQRALAYEGLGDLVQAREQADVARGNIEKHPVKLRKTDELVEPWELLARLYKRLGEPQIAWECMRNAAYGAGLSPSLALLTTPV
jgi:transcriptional regulator with XRE-family HTH domain